MENSLAVTAVDRPKYVNSPTLPYFFRLDFKCAMLNFDGVPDVLVVEPLVLSGPLMSQAKRRAVDNCVLVSLESTRLCDSRRGNCGGG